MYEEINVEFSGIHLMVYSSMPDTTDIRLQSGIASFASIFECFIFPFLAQSNKTMTRNLLRSPGA